MKTIALVLCFISLFSLSAMATKVESFLFDGSQVSKNIKLQDEIYRTEYHYEERFAWCYYTIRMGEYYRRQIYKCTEYVQVPFQSLDYYLNANINFNFENLEQNIFAKEQITVWISRDKIETGVKSSGSILMLYHKEEQNRSIGHNRYIDVDYNVKLIDLKRIKLPFQDKMKLISSSSQELLFEVGKIPNDVDYKYKLKISKTKFLSHDPLIFEGEVGNQFIKTKTLNSNRTLLIIDLNKLNLLLSKGKYKIEFQMSLNVLKSQILNNDLNIPSAKIKKRIEI